MNSNKQSKQNRTTAIFRLTVLLALLSSAGLAQIVKTINVGAIPVSIAVNPATNKIYVADSNSASITVIDGASYATTSVAVGNNPTSVAVNPVTNKIYVANYNDNSVSVIDGASNSVTSVPAGTQPFVIAVNSNTNQIYVANHTSNNVTIIDGASNTTSTVPAGAAPYAIAVNTTTNKIYVVNYSDNDVTVIDGVTKSTAIVPVGSIPEAIAINETTNQIYVANFNGNSVTAIDGVTNNTTTRTNIGNGPCALAVNPLTNQLYVVNQTDSMVVAVDGTTLQGSSVNVGSTPAAVAVNISTNQIYVANLFGSSATIIDGVTLDTTTIPTGQFAVAVAVNPQTGVAFIVNEDASTVTAIGGSSVANQTITFANPGTQAAGSTLTLQATASSGLPVSFTSTTPLICTVNSASARLLQAGTCTIIAAQSGDGVSYAPASATQTFPVMDLSLTSRAVSTSAGTITEGIVAPAGTSWTASSSAPWIHLSATSGTGSTAISISYDASTSAQRSGTVSFNNGLLSLTVQQAPAGYVPANFVGPFLSLGLNAPHAVAADSRGNLYIADTGSNTVKFFNSSTQSLSTLIATGLNAPSALALDASGNLYIADTGNHALKQWNQASAQLTTLVSAGLTTPLGLAVDNAGNLYIADSAKTSILKWTPGATQLVTAAAGFTQPTAVAVDFSGNLYVADGGQIKFWNASTNQTSVLASTTAAHPYGLTVDLAGNVYWGDSGTVKAWDRTQQTTNTFSFNLATPYVGSIDKTGLIYIADASNNAIRAAISGAISTVIAFPPYTSGTAQIGLWPATFTPSATSSQTWLNVTATASGAVSYSYSANPNPTPRNASLNVSGRTVSITQYGVPAPPVASLSTNGLYFVSPKGVTSGTQVVWVTNTGGNSLQIASATTSNRAFSADAQGATGVLPVPAGARWPIAVTFTPSAVGVVTATLTITDNSSTGKTQTVTLHGSTSPFAQTISWPAIPTQKTGATLALNATASSGLAVSYTSATPLVCTASGSSATLSRPGICLITASQTGNAIWAAATPVIHFFVVN